MKKMFALLLAFAMLFSVLTLSGCEKDDQDPSNPNASNNNNGNNNNQPTEPADLHALVSAAIKKTEEATSFNALMTMDLSMDLMGQKVDTISEYAIRASMADPEKPVMGMEGKMSMMGEEVPFSYYYDGEWMYCVMYGEGYKMPASLEEFQQEAGNFDEMVVDLPKSLFDGVTATTEGGVTKVELTADSDAFKELYDDVLVELFEDVLGEDTSAVTVEEIRIVVSMEDGYLSGYDMSFKAGYTIGEDYINYDMAVTIVYENINEEITVTPPEGYENFGEMDWG